MDRRGLDVLVAIWVFSGFDIHIGSWWQWVLAFGVGMLFSAS